MADVTVDLQAGEDYERLYQEMRQQILGSLGLPRALFGNLMTEQEWLTSDDPHAMLGVLLTSTSQGAITYGGSRLATDRKLGLFAVACCWEVSAEVGRYADWYLENMGGPAKKPAAWAWAWAGDQTGPSAVQRAALLRDIFGNPWRPSTSHQDLARYGILAWNNGTVPRMAQAIYDERHFGGYGPCPRCEGDGSPGKGRQGNQCGLIACGTCDGTGRVTLPNDLPLLADALLDAGCEDEDLLNHLRGLELCRGCSLPGQEQSGWCSVCDRHTDELCWVPSQSVHARGCWVVDLILGLS